MKNKEMIEKMSFIIKVPSMTCGTQTVVQIPLLVLRINVGTIYILNKKLITLFMSDTRHEVGTLRIWYFPS